MRLLICYLLWHLPFRIAGPVELQRRTTGRGCALPRSLLFFDVARGRRFDSVITQGFGDTDEGGASFQQR